MVVLAMVSNLIDVQFRYVWLRDPRMGKLGQWLEAGS